MPTIITRGAISARNAGTFAYVPPAPVPPVPPPPPPPPGPPPPPPPGPVYQTVTFTNNSFWTCPAGVYYVVNLEVYGGMFFSYPATWQYTTNIYAFYSQQGTAQAGSPSGFFSYEQAGNFADGVLAGMNSGGTGERDVTIFPYNNYYNPNTNGFYTEFEQFSYRIRGVASRASGPWDNRSGQPVIGIGNGWYIGAEVYYPGVDLPGTTSAALGYEAAGGTSPGQQFVTTASYVPVTPGQQYFILVGTEGGQVILQFVQ